MSRNLLTIKKNKYSPIDKKALTKWFKSESFNPVNFENKRFETLVYWIGYPIYYSLRENPGYTTFIKQGFGGSLLVFEIKLTESELDCQCYCPIMLFGFKRMEFSFQKKAMWITKYRKEGYRIMEQFKKFISTD